MSDLTPANITAIEQDVALKVTTILIARGMFLTTNLLTSIETFVGNGRVFTKQDLYSVTEALTTCHKALHKGDLQRAIEALHTIRPHFTLVTTRRCLFSEAEMVAIFELLIWNTNIKLDSETIKQEIKKYDALS